MTPITVVGSNHTKLAFRRIPNSNVKLEYGIQYNRDTFIPVGMQCHGDTVFPVELPDLTEIKQWCKDHDCGVFPDIGNQDTIDYKIAFRNEKELAWFLLRWS